jgi:hypothetical protein
MLTKGKILIEIDFDIKDFMDEENQKLFNNADNSSRKLWLYENFIKKEGMSLIDDDNIEIIYG